MIRSWEVIKNEPVKPGAYYLRSLKHQEGRIVLWWKAKNAGYTSFVTSAGLYTAEQINANLEYYNNDDTRPIPAENVLQCAELVCLL